jgi:cation diffusion facilitator family transporter
MGVGAMHALSGHADATRAERARAVRRVLLVTWALNLGVAGAKIAYGTLSHALSIRADGFHSLTDSANNIVGLLSITIASRPADEGHPYGHGKFEILAAGVVGLSLLAMAGDVVWSAALRWFGPQTTVPDLGPATYAVLLPTLLINWWVARYEQRRGAELDSAFLLTDAAHTRSDVLVTVGVISTAVFVQLGVSWLDTLSALFVAGFIAWAGFSVLRRNLGYLADAAVLDADAISAAAVAVPGVASTHKIRTRGTPGAVYVDLHIQIAPHLDVVQAHRVTHAVIDSIKGRFPVVADVLVHTEPAPPDAPYLPLEEEIGSGRPS